MNLPVIAASVLLVMFSLQLDTACAAIASDCDPVYEEFTVYSECDFNCQGFCAEVSDVCLCRFGYLRDLASGLCIPEDQCDPAPEEITFGCLVE